MSTTTPHTATTTRSRRRRRLGLATAVLVVGAGLAGCGTNEQEVPQRAPDDVPGQGSTQAGADPAPSAGTSSEATPAGPAECTVDDVSAAYVAGDAATGHRYGAIVVTNTSSAPCVVEGYGGLSYVGGGDGEQVGAAADRDASDGAAPEEPITLEPGDTASSAVAETTTGAYADGDCGAEPVDGFRVYLPDETESLFVEHPTDACADTDVHLLSHQAFVAG